VPHAIESRTIDMLAGVDTGTQIPITTIEGARPGPSLGLIAGNHGYEYPPILALQKLRGQIDPAKLAGTVRMLHVANMPSFLGRTVYFSPVDGKNLNRVYPGRNILYPRVDRDQIVKQGTGLADITDFFGRQIGEVRAPFDGVVLYIVATPPITKDQPVACLGAPRQAPRNID